MSQGYDTIAKDITGQLTAPVGWARMLIVFRILRNYRGYADYVLSPAPGDNPFYIIATHVSSSRPADKADVRYTALLDALSERGCARDMELSGKAVFVMKVTCP